MYRMRAGMVQRALMAAVVPLAALTLPVVARARIVSVTPSVQSTITSPNAGDFAYGYSVLGAFGSDTVSFLIPEVHAGDLTAASSENGWTVTEMTVSPDGFANAGKFAPGAYLDVVQGSSGTALTQNGLSFVFDSATGTPVTASFEFTDSNGNTTVFDPPVPDTRTPVPEPGTFALLAGGLGLIGLKTLSRRLS